MLGRYPPPLQYITSKLLLKGLPKARGFGNLQVGKGEVINCGAMHISPVRTDENNLEKANPIQLVEGL